MYFISGVIALVGSALVLSTNSLSPYSLTWHSLNPNSVPFRYGDCIAIGIFLFSLYCFHKHSKVEKKINSNNNENRNK